MECDSFQTNKSQIYPAVLVSASKLPPFKCPGMNSTSVDPIFSPSADALQISLTNFIPNANGGKRKIVIDFLRKVLFN